MNRPPSVRQIDEYVIQLDRVSAGSGADRAPLIITSRAHFGHWAYCGAVVKNLVTRAKDVAEVELASISDRLAHVSGVAATADKVASSLLRNQRHDVVAAALLHDVGYGPRVRNSGFHPLDGAAFLRSEGFPDVVSSLVAFHSGASEEVDERGLKESLSRFTPPPTDLLDILTYADMKTGPKGETGTAGVGPKSGSK